MLDELHAELNRKMDHTIEVIAKELAGVRTGRASAELLTPVMVDYYGTLTPLNQLASVNTPDAQLITVTPFDPSSVKEVEKAINASSLGLNAMSEGNTIRVPVPVLTEERRKGLVKHVHTVGEEGKIAIRNLRRDGNDQVKKLEKAKEISQDAERDAHEQIQQDTDGHIKRIEKMISQKEVDLLKV